MSGDKLVFDLANEIEDVPNVFVRKDWVNILDNQNGNYNSNQSVIDTSQLSNSNKYMSYREGYLAVPLLLVLSNAANNVAGFDPTSSAASADFAVGLKNWFGSIIHSVTLDFNGTTVIQQTPFINMYNSFKLMTSLSWQDVYDSGPSMGFYPDDPLSWSFQVVAGPPQAADETPDGRGVCNNTNVSPPFSNFGFNVGAATDSTMVDPPVVTNYSTFNSYRAGFGNEGFLRRQLYVNYDDLGQCGESKIVGSGSTLANVLTDSAADQLWKSRIIKKTPAAALTASSIEIAVQAFIQLRHIHSFFNQIPLIKGAFMKLTLNLNNCSTNFQVTNVGGNLTVQSVQNAVGGINPLMIASRRATGISGDARIAGGALGRAKFTYNNGGTVLTAVGGVDTSYIASISVGARCLNTTQAGLGGVIPSPMSSSIQLYVPAYSFNAVFEQAYISSPIKKVIYEDVYQYQVLNVAAGNGQINSLLTNGIANLRSVLILPFYSASDATHLCGTSIPPYQSPFDPAGAGPTSPLCILTNFNVVVSGQNAIYNTIRYGFETYLNQVAGCNSVNAGMTDGLSSGLINQQGWEMEYCYHYVDVSRMLPVEQQVPKSVQIIGQNTSKQSIDLICFLAYGCELSFDILSGARV
jgi:hypothetical protein